MAIGNSRGIGGLQKPTIFKESMKLKKNLQRGGWVCEWGEGWFKPRKLIFWGGTDNF